MQKDLVLRIRTQASWGTPYSCAPRRIDIVRSPDGSYYSEYSKVIETGKRVTAKRELNSTEVEFVLSQLSNARLPIAPDHQLGCDGSDTELEFGNYGCKSHFMWWADGPEEWALLDEIAQKVIEWSGVEDG